MCGRRAERKETPINIAVFADTHGRALLCFVLCARWQQETGERIDLILQAGDLGTFPEHARLDGATITWGRRDPSELAFRDDFARRNPEVEAVLQETTCPLIYVRGNHEDHNWLTARENRAPRESAIFAVDAYVRVFCLKTGQPFRFEVAGEHIDVLGIGRIGLRGGTPDQAPQERRPKYIQPYERERLRALSNGGDTHVDVLLTHDTAPGLMDPEAVSTASTGHARRGDEGGIQEIGEALDRYRPTYHFFGHYGGPAQHWLAPHGRTDLYKLADLNWDLADSERPLREGCMGILRWNSPDDHSFEIVRAPWLRDYSRSHWRSL